MKVLFFIVSYLQTLNSDKRGASAIEYALIAGLIAAGLIGVLTILGDGIVGFFQEIVTSLKLEDTGSGN